MRGIERIELMHAGLVALVAGVGGASGFLEPASVALGGLVIGGSTLLSALGLRWLLAGRRRFLAIGFLFAKLAAFMAILAVLVEGLHLPVDGIAFAAGVSCFPLAAVAEGLGVRRRFEPEVNRR